MVSNMPVPSINRHQLCYESGVVFMATRTEVVGMLATSGAVPDFDHLLESGILLGAERFNLAKATVRFPPPFEGLVGEFVEMSVAPLSKAALGSFTGMHGTTKTPRDEMVVLCAAIEDLEALNTRLVFVDRSCARRDAVFSADKSLLRSASWERIRHKNVKADPSDPVSVAQYDAAVWVWKHVPARALSAIICFNEKGADRVRSEIGDLSVPVIVNPTLFW